MAVPFSRPAYPGSRRRSQQARTQQSQQQQQSQQNSGRHPITRFLDGQGGIRLDQLSLTSRIAFYALYEAWRLLMDLTQQSTQSLSDQTSQPSQHYNSATSGQCSAQRVPTHTVLNNVQPRRNDEVHSNISTLPDVVESTQQQPRAFVDKCQTSSNQPDIIQDIVDTSTDEPDLAMPDFIPRDQQYYRYDQHYQSFEDFDFKRTKTQRSVSMSSDYFSLDGLSQIEEEDDQYRDLNQSFEKMDLENSRSQDFDDLKGINWSNLGNQLCEIASAFEVTYSPNLNENQRELYSVYRDLKVKTLALSRRDSSMTGLAKTICRQVLLSSIWILLKKIM